ncbi:MAG: inositol monophosphatase family protein [Gammaproteobacteria bacterium]|jgi:myo-inositol-1(or 4)-monophosphatase|nr:inositol monophosphatase family protein [Gammaproteobacteria bacterium]MDP6616290.1 inositol monophosphatase family protein [Gammaproteobacteria bacterium]MDP6694004.1 inositol monophosphatase family protein [Gammaproteobacteria bacterium]MDP7041070.1 inositol monophosphatase family protein [Gammaproteobacteria bacterium]
MQALLNTAIQAARRAGDNSMRYIKRLDELDVRSKSRNEFVTQVDLAAEQIIIESVQERYPEHGILGEETGKHGGDEVVWIIDPLDGTTNYIHGFPVFAVSIGVQVKGRMEVAVVYDPNRQELFTAIQGGGAQLDGRKIRVNHNRALEGSLIGTGFPYRDNDRWMEQYLNQFRAVMQVAGDIRRPGSAALDLCYLAAGRIDGFWEFGLQIWDIAAGSLILREAGGIISSMTDDGDYLETGNVIAGAPKVHAELEKLLKPFLGPTMADAANE